MPKLIEGNLEENRRTRYASLLEAAVFIALESGSAAITITSVAKRAGISRAGAYEYFSSKEELVSDLIIDEIKIWSNSLSSKINLAQTPQQKVLAWVQGSLDYILSGQHKLARELSSITIPTERINEVRQAHHLLMQPLIEALTQCAVSDPMRTAMYINGLLDVATRRIDSGKSNEGESDYVIALALQLIKE